MACVWDLFSPQKAQRQPRGRYNNLPHPSCFSEIREFATSLPLYGSLVEVFSRA